MQFRLERKKTLDSTAGWRLATRTFILFSLLAGGQLLPGLHASGLPTREEILARVYPGSSSNQETLFLTPEQIERAAEISGTEIPSAMIARFTLAHAGRPVGRAYVDTHLIRTKRESLLICLDANGKVLRVETTAFLEPPEYQLPERARRQYQGKSLQNNLILGDGLRIVAGATLTSRAVAFAVRRVLAIDKALSPEKSVAGRGFPKK